MSNIVDLWTPAGATYRGVASAGRNADTGGHVVTHRFMLKQKDKFGIEHKTTIAIVADESVSKAHIEEMVGNAFESWLIDVRMRHNKPAPTPEQRKEIGKILEQIRVNRNKRRGSSNNKIYYNGLK